MSTSSIYTIKRFLYIFVPFSVLYRIFHRDCNVILLESRPNMYWRECMRGFYRCSSSKKNYEMTCENRTKLQILAQ